VCVFASVIMLVYVCMCMSMCGHSQLTSRSAVSRIFPALSPSVSCVCVYVCLCMGVGVYVYVCVLSQIFLSNSRSDAL